MEYLPPNETVNVAYILLSVILSIPLLYFLKRLLSYLLKFFPQPTLIKSIVSHFINISLTFFLNLVLIPSYSELAFFFAPIIATLLTVTISFLIDFLNFLIGTRTLFESREKSLLRNMDLNNQFTKDSDKELIIDSVEEWKNQICRCTEICILAISTNEIKTFSLFSKRLIDLIEATNEWTMAYYLKLVLIKNGVNMIEIINLVGELKVLTVIKTEKEKIIKKLCKIIKIVDDKYDFCNIVSVLLEKKRKILNIDFNANQCDIKSIFIKNLSLWERFGVLSVLNNSSLVIAFIVPYISLNILFFYASLNNYFLLLFCLFFLFAIPFLTIFYILFENKKFFVSIAKKIIERALGIDKKINRITLLIYKFGVKYFIISNKIIDNFERIDDILDENAKMLNISLLIYFCTTFPMKRIRNFDVVQDKNMIQISRIFVLEDLQINKFNFYFSKIPLYIRGVFEALKSVIFHLVNLFKKIIKIIALLDLMFVFFAIVSDPSLDVFTFFYIAVIFLSVSIIFKLWRSRKYLQIMTCLMSLIVIVFSLFFISYLVYGAMICHEEISFLISIILIIVFLFVVPGIWSLFNSIKFSRI